MKISDCMTRNVQLANPEMTLQEAAGLMAKCDAGVLPVGDNDRLVGMLTDRDIAIRGMAEGKGPKAKVHEAMSSDVCWCYEDENVEGVLRRLGDEQIRRMPVLNRNKRLVGIVAMADLTASAQPEQTGATLSAISRHGGQHTQMMH
ncbi:CBS domain-containing protein [Phenylobacterium sp. LjRoot225]|uniref:CBS domain-containing protein n=1 Tax=Phenylobacterium sp. LjRoot225 TaxID=3342285 RepID=UPI003ECC8292